MKPTIYHHYNRPKIDGEVNTKPSKTVPDQSMTIRQIIQRTQKGLPVTGVKVPVYNETEIGIMPDLRKMDISEIHDLKNRLKRSEDQIRRQLQQEEEKRQQQETEEFYKKKFGTPPQPIPITPTEEV